MISILRRSASKTAALVLVAAWFLAAAFPAAGQYKYSEVQTVHAFQPSEGQGLQSRLLLGRDGNFYGATKRGGSANLGTIYKITPGGVVTVLHQFVRPETNAAGADDVDFIQAKDGSFYGTILGGGSAYGGIIFRITPEGIFSTVHEFGDGTYGDRQPRSILQAADGNFYGIYSAAIPSGVSIYRLTPAGEFSSITGMENAPLGLYGLMQARDGNFYGLASGQDQTGALIRITPDGKFTTLYNFSPLIDLRTNADGAYPQGPLIEGQDGKLYGTTLQGGTDGVGTFFSFSLAGELTTLRQFNATVDPSARGALLTQAENGDFIATAEGGGRDDQGVIFSLKLDGTFTYLQSLWLQGDGKPERNLIQTGDGTFYGVSNGSSTLKNGGTLIRVVVSTHPPLFNGEVKLDNETYYLQLPGGQPFGYYTYLADPNFIYHFDLGYEYVFNADDGEGGVYFYDFKSNGFFYTGPRFQFPYLYDFTLNSTVYYYPDPSNAGRYNTNGLRYFYVFRTGQIISK